MTAEALHNAGMRIWISVVVGVLVLAGCQRKPEPVEPPSVPRAAVPQGVDGGGGEVIVARVNGVPVTRNNIVDQAILNSLMLPPVQDPAKRRQLQQALLQQGLQEYIDHLLLVQAGEQLGLEVDEQLQRQALEQLEGELEQRPLLQRDIEADEQLPGRLAAMVREGLLAQATMNRKLAAFPLAGTAEYRETYQQHKERFGHGHLMRVAQIVIPVTAGAPVEQWEAARTRLQAVYHQLEANNLSWSEAYKQYNRSVPAPPDGDLGYVPQGMLEANVERIVLEMEVGEFSPPVRSSQGYHLLRLLGKRVPGYYPFEDVVERIKETLLQDRIKAVLEELHKQAEVELYQPG